MGSVSTMTPTGTIGVGESEVLDDELKLPEMEDAASQLIVSPDISTRSHFMDKVGLH